MTTIHHHIICCLTALAIALGAGATTRAWEEVDHFPSQQGVENVTTSDEVGVTIREGYVYVTVRQTTNVKIFTILGQLVIQQQLRPGVYRFRLGTRGIYILKAGALTRRVTN